MKFAAVIIDDRHLPNMEEIILGHEIMLPVDWQVWHIGNEPVNSISNYNRLLTSKRFWRCMPDKVLIFQHDSMLLREGIEEFLDYDFIGAPIKNIPGCMNGGLSLRDRATMLKIINNFPYMGESIHGNEDIYFCNGLEWVGAKIPTMEVAQQFSVETIFGLGSLGYHAIDKYLTASECTAIRGQYGIKEKRAVS